MDLRKSKSGPTGRGFLALLLAWLGATICAPSLRAAPLTNIGNVYHVSQITGLSANSATEARWGLAGTDIGTMFHDFSGATFLAFGDSFGYFDAGGAGGIDWRHNLLAKTTDDTPANGLDFSHMISDAPNHAKTIIPREPGDVTTIPNGGLSLGDKLFIHYMNVQSWGDPGEWTTSSAGLAWSVDHGQNWTKTNLWVGTSGFSQCALLRNGGYVYLFGIPNGRFGGVKLARVPEVSLLNIDAYRYWTGGDWARGEASAVTIVPAPVGELTVAYNDFLGRYIMLFLNEDAHAVQIRSAPELTGPWSEPLTVTTAYNFGGYAPMLHPNYSSGQEIYFTLSAWGPYNVHLLHATLNPTAASWGPFDLPGRVEAENFREGGQNTGYYDTTTANLGNTYRSGRVDIFWNDTEDAHQVGWIANGEWLSYKVNVRQTGAYKFRLKYGSASGCRVQVDAPGGNPVHVPATNLGGTGGASAFQLWEPDTVFQLEAGPRLINLYFPIGGCDITWWEIYPAWSGSTYRLNAGGGDYTDSAGKIWSADAFFTGGSAASLTNAEIANTLDDPLYRSERSGAFAYALPVANGVYEVRLKFAENSFTQNGQRRFHVDIEGARLLKNYDPTARSGGQNIAHDELFTLSVDDGLLNIQFTNGAAGVPKISALEITPAHPNLYANHRVPGHIEAEEFHRDAGAYSDTTPGNAGGVFRGSDVDIREKIGGGYQVGWVADGEWLSYHVNVAAAGNYKVRLRYSSGSGGARAQVAVPGGSPVYVSATTLAATVNYDTFITWDPPQTFFLNAGPQWITLYFPTGGCDLDYFEIYAPTPGSPAQIESAVVQSGADFQMSIAVTADTLYRLQRSTNLVDWDTLTNLSSASGRLEFTDPNAARFPRRFYRAVTP